MRPAENNLRYLSDEERNAVASEFLLSQQRWYVLFFTLIFLIGVGLGASADFYVVIHLIQSREADAFGNPGEITAGSVATASFTIVAFLLIGSLMQQKTKWATGAAVFLYAVVLSILALLLAPVEMAHFRSSWTDLVGGSVFSSVGAESSEAPAWFTGGLLLLWAVGYSLPGLLFCCAKNRLVHWIGVWHARGQAKKFLVMAEEAGEAQDKIVPLGTLLARFDDPEVWRDQVDMVLRRAIGAYTKQLEKFLAEQDQILLDLHAEKAAKDYSKDLIASARRCLKEAQALTF